MERALKSVYWGIRPPENHFLYIYWKSEMACDKSVMYRAIWWDSWCRSSALLPFSCPNNCTPSQTQCRVNTFRNFAAYLAWDLFWCSLVVRTAGLRLWKSGAASTLPRQIWAGNGTHQRVQLRFWCQSGLEEGPATSLQASLPSLEFASSFRCPPGQRAHSRRLNLVSSLSRDIWGPYSKRSH